jgi:O-antigen ligase
MHPTYFTIYLNIATLLVIDLFSSKEQPRWMAVLQVMIFVFFMVCIMLLSSRTAIITSYITILLLIGLKIKDGFNAKKHVLAGVIALALIIVSDFLVFSHSNRFEQVEILFNGDNDFYKFDKKEYNSATIRIPLWINAAQVIENNKLLGVGTGDIKEELDSVYKKNKFAYAEASHFSPHNQVFHTGIILGFVGIALLLAMLLIPLYYSIRYKSYLLLCFIVIFLFNMMTESILERQAGLILFSFFYVILVSELYEDIKKAGELPA